jgi:membrane protein implicated in regulation of membrane protease activity
MTGLMAATIAAAAVMIATTMCPALFFLRFLGLCIVNQCIASVSLHHSVLFWLVLSRVETLGRPFANGPEVLPA